MIFFEGFTSSIIIVLCYWLYTKIKDYVHVTEYWRTHKKTSPDTENVLQAYYHNIVADKWNEVKNRDEFKNLSEVYVKLQVARELGIDGSGIFDYIRYWTWEQAEDRMLEHGYGLVSSHGEILPDNYREIRRDLVKKGKLKPHIYNTRTYFDHYIHVKVDKSQLAFDVPFKEEWNDKY